MKKNKNSYRIDQKYLLNTLKKILEIPSPSGYTKDVMAALAAEAEKLGYKHSANRKGGLLIHVPGKSKKTVCVSVHADTNGAMVSSIESGGNLRFKRVGGPISATLDSEYCTIISRKNNKEFRGTILSDSPSSHVYPDAGSRKRDTDNMYIRLDADVCSKDDTLALGIAPGDYVAIDVKFERAGGFVKSRFLDDKASVATVMSVLKYLFDNKLKPQDNLIMMCTNFEEVGHGAAYIPEEIEEMLAVDMGCIGLDLSCTEKDVSICAMDSSGPYDYELTNKLIALASAHNIPHAVDIYPMYGSDASAAMRGGNNIRAALIGPGIQASHGMERTHETALYATAELILHYLGV
ncbi:MAG: M42 family metallopeptidase [Bacillota bacterium]|nr:M42 family metallopeptidase [Bacillota bacterium]